MSLKYYDAAQKIRQPNPKASYYADYNAILDFSFDNAPNVVYDEVEYEQTYGENDFVKINKVRVDTILNYNTGIILGDDYKTFIFAPDFPVTPYYGMKFRWQGSYWLVINTNSYASISNTAEVRRCNNVLRFFDKDGSRIYEPCILDYTLRFANNEDTMTITVGNGEQKVWCQRNKRTTTIKPNDRFLFGTPEQRVAFRLYGGGTKNYMNGVTMDDNSPTITEFYVDHYETNPLFDDFENGFADAYLNEVTIKIEDVVNSLNVDESAVLSAKVYKGTKEVANTNVLWKSSDDTIIEISDNIATAKQVGSATITAYIENTTIQSSIDMNVVEEPTEDVIELIAEPNIDYVLQNKSQQFVVYLYKNGIKQIDSVSFADMSVGIPVGKYTIVVDNNNAFTLFNKGMYMDAPVVVRCVCGETTLDMKIKLRGLY